MTQKQRGLCVTQRREDRMGETATDDSNVTAQPHSISRFGRLKEKLKKVGG